MTKNTQNFSIDVTSENHKELYNNEASYIKRFMERWNADPSFRNQMYKEQYQSFASYGLEINPEEIIERVTTSSLNQCEEITDENTSIFMKALAASASNRHFKAWRERQIARCTRQFKKLVQDGLIHAPICFELSKGCSVGCSFCAVSATRLSNIFIYNEENAELWYSVLELIKEILGPAAGTGFCYWATDPLDNPDYEKFCCDFHAILGMFPQTTTAQPLKDPTRTRSLLKLSSEKGCALNRFSILSLKMLNQVHEEFSPEELAFVKLELHNQEANTIKANAGRARERNLKSGKEDSTFPEQGTIACVTGFLFNMVDRSVKLISPCNADDRWPLGYMVFDEGTFSNVEELRILLGRMITDNMHLTVRPTDLISFPRDVKYKSLTHGFELSTPFKTFKFRHDSYLRELGLVIYKGDKTAKEIADIFEKHGVSSDYVFDNLNLMFEKGVLDNEPKSNAVNT